MAITTNIVIPTWNFAGNEIPVQLYAGDNVSKRFRVYEEPGNVLLYQGLIYSMTETYSVIYISSLFASLESIAGVGNYKLVLVDDQDTETDDTLFTVYGGGISKIMQRSLNGTNIFAAKLKNATNNFFLTTRTGDRIITIPEDELLPLYFYKKGMKFTVKSSGVQIASYDYTGDAIESLGSIDFRAFPYTVFDIFSESGYSCSIVITEAEQSTDMYLKFRNSWGAQDMIALWGNADYTPTFADVTKVNKWDATINAFTVNQKRKQITNQYTITTGYHTDAERLLIIDMLLSDEVIFIVDGAEYAVNVTTDSTLFATTSGTPVNINLKIELKDTDNCFSPIVIESVYDVLTEADLTEIYADGESILIEM